jgi:hypothetical protein
MMNHAHFETAKFNEGEIVRYVKSGKIYVVTGFTGSATDRIGVYGWRDGRQFGPIRFLDAEMLEPVIGQKIGQDCNAQTSVESGPGSARRPLLLVCRLPHLHDGPHRFERVP